MQENDRSGPYSPQRRQPTEWYRTTRMPYTPSESLHEQVARRGNDESPDAKWSHTSQVDGEARSQTAWVGPVVFLVALGLLGQAYIYYSAQATGSPSPVLFYLSLGVIYAPSAALIISNKISSNTRIWLTLCMSLALLATSFLRFPLFFPSSDELVHQSIAETIYTTGHLFHPNTELPEASDYPGLEITTTAIQHLTGLSFHVSGIVVLATASIITVLALIKIMQRITGSVRVSCLVALVYTANQEYMSFNQEFSYASLALPLAFLCIYVFVLRLNSTGLLKLVPPVAVVLALTVTHHITSLVLVIFLWIWHYVTLATNRRVPYLLTFAAISLAAVALWTLFAGSLVIPYVTEALRASFDSLTGLLHGSQAHKFFSDTAGYKTPKWEAILSVAATLIITLTLVPTSWYAVRRWRLLGTAGLVLLVFADFYPIIPAGHLTVSAGEDADRAAPFIFIGIGFIFAVWWFHALTSTGLHESRSLSLRFGGVLVAALTVCFLGGTVIGGSDWTYMPGKYMVEADNRSVDQLALAAGYWEGQNLAPNSEAYSDRDNGLIALAYGHLRVITIDQSPASTLLLRRFTSNDLILVCKLPVNYLIADARLATGLPQVGFYIASGEFGTGVRTAPPPVADLVKFDSVPQAERIYDNGAIRIFDLGGIPCPG